MKLKAIKKTFFEVEYQDLEEFATKIYNLHCYEFAAVEECGNDSQHSFRIDGKIHWADGYDVQSIRDGHVPVYKNRLLLNLLCNDGHIEPGEYIIRVSW